MTIRQEMLTSAKRSANLLGESTSLVVSFVRRQLTPAGGFRGRSEASDLYYTLFAIESLIALDAPLPTETIAPWIASFGDGNNLDLVHLACLARCRVAVGLASDGPAILARIETYRSEDGGYSETPSQTSGTAYGAFLALGAHQDVGGKVANPDALADSLASLQGPEGGFGNSAEIPGASVPATAAAITVLRHLGRRVDEAARAWLAEQIGPDGGMGAWSGAPMSDLLSTAVGLHALRHCSITFDDVRQRCLDFIDSLWSSQGGFRGHQGDETLDCEYAFYGLLALGNLDDSP
ncbi:MAG: terpene cyclase/mutase family protein [Phycisphaerae bacterium]|jgi:hypothetical protein|nr:terpene cyclase/mutase family protein [Phycisphaerae bacterium]